MYNLIDAKTKWPSTAGPLKTPAGDLGKQRDNEMSKAFPKNIKRVGPDQVNPLNMSKPRLMNKNSDQIVGSIKSGSDTVGGAVGGKYDSGDYSGVKAGTKKRR